MSAASHPTPSGRVTSRRTLERRRHPYTLVLGGGALRGIAHVGVLAALERAGLCPRAVVGTSVGAMIGAAHAAGQSAEVLAAWARTLKRRDLFQLSSRDMLRRGVGASAVCTASPLEALVARLVPPHLCFRDLPVDLTVVATDLARGEPVAFTAAHHPDVRVSDTVVASSSIPGVFPPRALHDRTLADGMSMAPLPVELARPDWPVVAVSLVHGDGPTGWQGRGALELAMRSAALSARQLSALSGRMRPDAHWVMPDLSQEPFFAFDRADALMAAGDAAMTAVVSRLRAALAPPERAEGPERRGPAIRGRTAHPRL